MQVPIMHSESWNIEVQDHNNADNIDTIRITEEYFETVNIGDTWTNPKQEN